jgi:hypothetical protein
MKGLRPACAGLVERTVRCRGCSSGRLVAGSAGWAADRGGPVSGRRALSGAGQGGGRRAAAPGTAGDPARRGCLLFRRRRRRPPRGLRLPPGIRAVRRTRPRRLGPGRASRRDRDRDRRPEPERPRGGVHRDPPPGGVPGGGLPVTVVWWERGRFAEELPPATRWTTSITQSRVLQPGTGANLAHPLRVRLDGTPELDHLRQRPVTRLIPRHIRGVERADLHAHTARLEPRKPVPIEQALPTAAQDSSKDRSPPGSGTSSSNTSLCASTITANHSASPAQTAQPPQDAAVQGAAAGRFHFD